MVAQLFTPCQLRGVTLRNRIVVSPMCQYQGVDGKVTDWHLPHYASLARGGAGLVIVEATAVSPEGRITPGCLGLWDDAQIEGLAAIAKAIKASGAVPGIQLAHAGRKASLLRPWESDGDCNIPEGDPAAWEAIAPSALAFGGTLQQVPKAMSVAEIKHVQSQFAEATCRALQAGFEWLELHFAHGFLAQTFFSKQTNLRDDVYGGDFAGRSRFLNETVMAAREAWRPDLPLTVKFGCVEFDGRDDDTWPEVIELVKHWRTLGVDLLDVSIGFTTSENKIPWGQPMLAPLAAKLRDATGMAISLSWNVEKPDVAEDIIANGKADLVCIAKAFLANPHYVFHLARHLGVTQPASVLPQQYAHWLKDYQPC